MDFEKQSCKKYTGEIDGTIYRITRSSAGNPWRVSWYDDDLRFSTMPDKVGGWAKCGHADWIDGAIAVAQRHAENRSKANV